MRKKTKHCIMLMLTLIMIVNMSIVASAAGNAGSLNGYSWSTSLTGNSLYCYASTTYNLQNVGRSVTLYGTYIGSDFTGTRTVSNGAGSGTVTTVSTAVSAPNSSIHRFISASSSHYIDSITNSNWIGIN